MRFWSKRGPVEFRDEWRSVLHARMTHWSALDSVERARVEGVALHLMREKRWEAARGFELTDDIKVTIAAQAALLVLGLDAACYRGVGTIIVHPSTIVMHGARAGPAPGLVSDGPLPLLGQAQYEGPVIIAWDAARSGARHPERGHNVVYHEFAHKIDMLDGVVDGTPPLGSDAEVRRWVDVCTAEFDALRMGRGGPLLRDYGAINPGEFFAVATEVFFGKPIELEQHKPALYGVLSGFYRQDPAARVRRSGSSEPS